MLDNHKSIKRRHFKSKFLKGACLVSIILTLSFLFFFILDVVLKGYTGFFQSKIRVEVHLNSDVETIPLRAVDKPQRNFVSQSFFRELPNLLKDNPKLLGTSKYMWVLAKDDADQYLKGKYSNLSDSNKKILDAMKKTGNAKVSFNWNFFTNGDSKLPEYAGIKSALAGSFFTILVTMLFSVPIGVMTAIYLEEFAKESKIARVMEINISNLVAVPSIIFGLLGLAIFIWLFGVPRSSPLVGGLTLGLMTFPFIVVSSRAALSSVPDSIRHAGFALGLTKWQVVRGNVLPMAIPGILTGTIIGLAQALGETAPLILIGMTAFVQNAPDSILSAATVLPAQIFTWASMPQRAYIEKTSAGIIVLILFLLIMNSIAIYIRRKYILKGN